MKEIELEISASHTPIQRAKNVLKGFGFVNVDRMALSSYEDAGKVIEAYMREDKQATTKWMALPKEPV